MSCSADNAFRFESKRIDLNSNGSVAMKANL